MVGSTIFRVTTRFLAQQKRDLGFVDRARYGEQQVQVVKHLTAPSLSTIDTSERDTLKED